MKRREMKPIPFNLKTDIAPIPFDEVHLDLARKMKKSGLKWKPHVGCFVWDPERLIETESPFPLRVYFILSLPRFINIFGSPEKVAEKLVWLPTWYQARVTALGIGIDQNQVTGLYNTESFPAPGDDLSGIYRLILEKLRSG